VTLAVAPLPQAGATIPDPRRTHGRRDAAAALLSLAVVAGLANHAAVLASAAWAARPTRHVRRAVGFRRAATPHQTTRQRRLGRRDPVAVAAAVERVFDPPRRATCARAAARAWRPVRMTD